MKKTRQVKAVATPHLQNPSNKGFDDLRAGREKVGWESGLIVAVLLVRVKRKREGTDTKEKKERKKKKQEIKEN